METIEERAQELQDALNMPYDRAYELALFEAGLMISDIAVIGADGKERDAPIGPALGEMNDPQN
jgi:hypothetical protein